MSEYSGYVTVSLETYIEALHKINEIELSRVQGQKIGAIQCLAYVGKTAWAGSKLKYFIHHTVAGELGLEFVEQKFEEKIRNIDREEQEKKAELTRKSRIKAEIKLFVSRAMTLDDPE